MSDAAKFRERLVAIGELYGKEITPPLMDLYWQAFGYMAPDDFSLMLTKHTLDPDRGRFFPKPADLIYQVSENDGDIEDKAQLAWGVIMGEMRRVGVYGNLEIADGQAMATIQAMGGWRALCGTLTKDMEWKRKEFISVYKTYERTPLDQLPSNLPGLVELENHKKSQPSGLQKLLIGAEAFKKWESND